MRKEIDTDARRFINKIDNLSHGDRIEALKNMLEKYFLLSTCDHMMDKHDLQTIISSAGNRFSRDTVPIFLGDKKRKVDQSELANLFVIEATIEHLNKNDCLKKMAKFDKKEDKL